MPAGITVYAEESERGAHDHDDTVRVYLVEGASQLIIERRNFDRPMPPDDETFDEAEYVGGWQVLQLHITPTQARTIRLGLTRFLRSLP